MWEGDHVKTVAPLLKVDMSLQAIDESGRVLNEPDSSFSFIHGVSSGGLTHLEQILENKSEGQQAILKMSQGELQNRCGHLLGPILQNLNIAIYPKMLILQMQIDKISTPSHREVISAMTGAVGSGCGGASCDCGCS